LAVTLIFSEEKSVGWMIGAQAGFIYTSRQKSIPWRGD